MEALSAWNRAQCALQVRVLLLLHNKYKELEMGFEIERKFLAMAFDPEKADGIDNIVELLQGYTAEGIRLTKRYNKKKKETDYKINYKSGRGLVRAEAQCAITEDVFNALWPLTKNQRILKTRYIIPQKIGELEIDVYHGCKMLPLQVAEIEFPTEGAAKVFDAKTLPEWVGKEVTGKAKYINKNLATKITGL